MTVFLLMTTAHPLLLLCHGSTISYFDFDAKKSGGLTLSHLRVGPHPLATCAYEVLSPHYIGCHEQSYVRRYGALIPPGTREVSAGGDFTRMSDLPRRCGCPGVL